MKYFIGIDVGTTHCKAIAANTNGEVIYSLQSSFTSLQQQTGQHEQVAEQIFEQVITLLRQMLQQCSNKEIIGISFSTAMHSIMAIDTNGKPLTNVFTWADTRCAKYADELLQNKKAHSLYAQTGVPIHPMNPLCKLLWLRHERSEVFAKAFKFISIKEYIFFQTLQHIYC